jgi:hypothetical protein
MQIYIVKEGNQLGPFDEQQLQDQLGSGAISPTDLAWQEGLSDWQPLSQIMGQPSPIPPPLIAQGFHFTKDPARLTAFLKIMLWISLFVGVVSLFSNFAQYNLANPQLTAEAAKVNDARQRIIAIFHILVFIVTAIVFLKWVYRANLNSRGFGAQNLKFTPGWSIGYYVIPILGLYRPYQAMKEIWKVSKSPLNWSALPGCSLLVVWWTLWLMDNAIGQLDFRTSLNVHDISSLKDSTVISIISCLVHIPLCLTAISLISTIYKQQKQLVEQSS